MSESKATVPPRRNKLSPNPSSDHTSPAQPATSGGSLRLAIYARVSTADHQCEMQLRDLRQYAAARGWAVFDEYVDTGWSGKNADRPALKRCVADAKARRFDAIAVWKLDRWGR